MNKTTRDVVRNLVLLAAVLVVMMKCAPVYEDQIETSQINPYTNIERYVDEEAGVVCWLYAGYQGGLSCLPIDQTDLKEVLP